MFELKCCSYEPQLLFISVVGTGEKFDYLELKTSLPIRFAKLISFRHLRAVQVVRELREFDSEKLFWVFGSTSMSKKMHRRTL